MNHFMELISEYTESRVSQFNDPTSNEMEPNLI